MSQKPRGRGRGRSISTLLSNENSSNTADEKKSINDIIYQIDVLLIGSDGDSNQYKKLLDSANVAVKRIEDIHEIVAVIHNACLNDETFIPVGSKLCCSLCPVEADGIKFKRVLLDALQKDFEERERTRKDLPSRFLNSVKFLGQIFTDMRIGDSPFQILAVALTNYLEQILELNTTSAESLLFQELNCGKDLKSCAPEDFEKLLERMRQKIIDDSSSKNERAIFLRLFELCIQNWNTLSGSTDKFYRLNCVQLSV